jgi:hypothetical protein
VIGRIERLLHLSGASLTDLYETIGKAGLELAASLPFEPLPDGFFHCLGEGFSGGFRKLPREIVSFLIFDTKSHVDPPVYLFGYFSGKTPLAFRSIPRPGFARPFR